MDDRQRHSCCGQTPLYTLAASADLPDTRKGIVLGLITLNPRALPLDVPISLLSAELCEGRHD